MRNFLMLAVSSLICFTLHAQRQAGAELDHYIFPGNNNALVPTLYYEGPKNWLTILRYNYEEDQTLSVCAGKTFVKNGRFIIHCTPMAGYQAGKLNGISAGLRTEGEDGKFSFFSEPQYCMSFKKSNTGFLYAWTEASVRLTKLLYAGLALQQTKPAGIKILNVPGVQAGLNLGNFTIPVYYFRSSSSAWYVVGLHWALRVS